MKVSVSLPGFKAGSVVVESSSWGGAPRLLQDGQLAERGPRHGEYVLRRRDGGTATARMRLRAGGLDPLPTLEVDGTVYPVGQPIPLYTWVWIGLPLLLLIVGGAIGAAVGVVASWLNAGIFRSERSLPVRYALSAAVNLAAVGVYAVLSALFRTYFGG